MHTFTFLTLGTIFFLVSLLGGYIRLRFWAISSNFPMAELISLFNFKRLLKHSSLYLWAHSSPVQIFPLFTLLCRFFHFSQTPFNLSVSMNFPMSLLSYLNPLIVEFYWLWVRWTENFFFCEFFSLQIVEYFVSKIDWRFFFNDSRLWRKSYCLLPFVWNYLTNSLLFLDHFHLLS